MILAIDPLAASGYTMKAGAVLFLALAMPCAPLSAAGNPFQFHTVKGLLSIIDIPFDAIGKDGDYILTRDGKKSSISIEESTPHVDERHIECSGHTPTFVINKKNTFAYSCIIGTMARYHVEKYGKTYRMGASDVTELIEYTIIYPYEQNKYYSYIIQHMTQSFRFIYGNKWTL